MDLEKFPWVGLDIGGANIKGAHTSGWSNHLDFSMWKQPTLLATALGELLADAPPFLGVGVTMTGSWLIVFKREQKVVATILDQITTILPAQLVRVYSVHGTWAFRRRSRALSLVGCGFELGRPRKIHGRQICYGPKLDR